jgi:hypothetical protein
VRPVRQTPIGGVESANGDNRQSWLNRVQAMGERAA